MPRDRAHRRERRGIADPLRRDQPDHGEALFSKAPRILALLPLRGGITRRQQEEKSEQTPAISHRLVRVRRITL